MARNGLSRQQRKIKDAVFAINTTGSGNATVVAVANQLGIEEHQANTAMTSMVRAGYLSHELGGNHFTTGK